jgi:hypothetical protein
MGWIITFTQAVIPQYLQSPVAWIWKNLKLQKRIETLGIHQHCSQFKFTMDHSLAHGADKIESWPSPQDIKQLQCFLGIVIFTSVFCPIAQRFCAL